MFLRVKVKGRDGSYAACLAPSLDRTYLFVIDLKTGVGDYVLLQDVTFEMNDSGAFKGVAVRYPGFCRSCGGKEVK